MIETVHACGRSGIVSLVSGGTESLRTESDCRCDGSTGCDMGPELPFLSGCSVLTTVSMGGRGTEVASPKGLHLSGCGGRNIGSREDNATILVIGNPVGHDLSGKSPRIGLTRRMTLSYT